MSFFGQQHPNTLKRAFSYGMNPILHDTNFTNQSDYESLLERSPSLTAEELFFAEVKRKKTLIKANGFGEETLKYHGIQIIKDGYQDPLQSLHKKLFADGNNYIEIKKSQLDGLSCEYEVLIGRFFLTIKVLNLHRKAEENWDREEDEERLGRGTFGYVKRVRAGNLNIALKRIKFETKIQPETATDLAELIDITDLSNPVQIRKAIKEYCMYKICSMLEIGPKVLFRDTYDLVCYNDCIEFQMEQCEKKIFTDSEKDILDCVSTLHAWKLVHKDIKDENILYSPTYEKYVLIDFGMATSIKEDLGEKTLTKFEGTQTYASPQMLQIRNNRQVEGWVDLYKNDYHCIMKTFEGIKPVGDSSSESLSYGSNSLQFAMQNNFEQEPNYCFDLKRSDKPLSKGADYNTSATSYGGNPTQRQQDEELNKEEAQFNFYEMKALYNIIEKKEICREDVERIKEVCRQVCDDNQEILSRLLKAVLSIISPGKQHEKYARNLKNRARIYGANSEKAFEKAMEICEKKLLANFDEAQVQTFSNYKKYTFIKLSYQNFIKDMERHQTLGNRKQLINSMRGLLEEYLHTGNYEDFSRQQILLKGAELFIMEDMNKQEQNQLFINLYKVLHRSEPPRDRRGELKEIDCQELFENIFEVVTANKELETKAMFKYVRLYEKLHNFKKMKEIVEKLQQQIKQQFTENPQKRKQLVPIFIKCQLHISEFYSRQEEYGKAIKLIENCLDIFLKYPDIDDVSLYIACLELIVIPLFNQQMYSQAQKYNQQYLRKVKQAFPLKDNGKQFGLYHYNRGMILMNSKNFREAIKVFQKGLDCLVDEIIGICDYTLIRNIMFNYGLCYGYLGQFEKALHVYERLYGYSRTYHFRNPEKTIQILHQIIISKFKMGKIDHVIEQDFQQLAALKNQVIDSKILNEQQRFYRGLEIFPLQKALINVQLHPDQCLLIKKYLVQCIDPYLPRFFNNYYNLCEDLANEYINNQKAFSKGLPYVWKMFVHSPKQELNQTQFKQRNAYVDLLMKNNSWRRALKFLKTYAYTIPQEMTVVRKQAFTLLQKLTCALSTQEKNFYALVCKEKAYRNEYYEERAFQRIQRQKIEEPLKRIWLKKMARFNQTSQQASLRAPTNEIEFMDQGEGRTAEQLMRIAFIKAKSKKETLSSQK